MRLVAKSEELKDSIPEPTTNWGFAEYCGAQRVERRFARSVRYVVAVPIESPVCSLDGFELGREIVGTDAA